MAEINDLLSNISNIKTDIKSAIENKGQNVTNFASYPNAIENISSGGGVYQYNSLESMYADIPNKHSGDIGAVYYFNQSSVQPGDILNDVTFPKQVTFDIAITSSASLMIRGTEMYCQCRLNSTQFYIEDWSGTIPRIMYTSSDGLTYMRTDTYDDTYNFNGATMPANANINICKFFITGSINFDGLFQHNGTNFNLLPNTGLNASTETVWDRRFYGNNGVQIGILNQTTDLTLNQLKDRVNLYSNISYLELNKSITNIYGMLRNCQNLTTVPNFDTSNVIEMSFMFQSCHNLITVPNFDTGNVTNMSNMFQYCANLTTVPNFDTSNVTNIYSIFDTCINLTTIPNFDTSNAIDMSFMFWNCYNLATVPNFNTSNAIIMYGMFQGCHNLTAVPNFDTSNVTTMTYMFRGCNNLINISSLDISNVTSMSYMFENCDNLTTVPNFNAFNATNMSNMFYNCNNLSNSSYANIANGVPMAYNLENYYISNLSLNINRFNSSQNLILGNKYYVEMLPYAINSSKVSSYWNIRINNSTWTNISKGNYDVVGQNLRNNISKDVVNIIVTDIGSEGTLYYAGGLFNHHYNLKSINLSNLKTDKLKRCEWMFGNCYNLTTVSNFNTSNVVNMRYMFHACYNLTTVPNFDTSRVDSTVGMFYGCHNLTTVPNFNTSNVTSMISTFHECTNLTTVPNWDTSNVINMYGMFNSCTSLTTVSNWNTSKVTMMSNMFYNCTNLISVPNFDTNNVRYMNSMFYECHNLTTVSNFNTSNVINMSYMFIGCHNLTTVPNFNTSNVTSMYCMFDEIINLVNVPQLNTSNVVNLGSMFYACNNLSNESIQNIINMCLNSNITNTTYKNLNNTNSYSPLFHTKFDSSYYQNRLTELDAAGWTY